MSDRDVKPENLSQLPTDRLVEIVAMFHVHADALIEIATAFDPNVEGYAPWCDWCDQSVVDGCKDWCPGLLARRGAGGGVRFRDHYHRCPECYEAVPCGIGACSIFPDHRDGNRDFGGYCLCDRCEARRRVRAEDISARADREPTP